MPTYNYLSVPTYMQDKDEHLRQTANAINQLRDGKVNSTGEITLTNSSTTTTLTDARIGGDSLIFLMPVSSDSASENWYITGIGDGTATINHSSAATTRTFKYAIFG